MADRNHPNAPIGETADCWNCFGHGWMPAGYQTEDCHTCGGSGLVPAWVYTINNE